MSNVAEAKKRMEEIESQLSNQQTYAKLKEEERLKLFQDYLLSMAQSNEEYHANEAANEKRVKKNMKLLEKPLEKMTKVPYGRDTVRLLNMDCPQMTIFLKDNLSEEEKISNRKARFTWESYVDRGTSCGKYYLDARKNFSECIKNGDIQSLVDMAEEIFMDEKTESYKARFDGNVLVDNKSLRYKEFSEKELEIQDRKEAFENSITEVIKTELRPTIVNGKEVLYPYVTPESEKFIKAFNKEIARRHIPDVLEVHEKSLAKAEQLKTENIPEIALMKDNPKFLKKLGRCIVGNQDPAGERLGARWQAQWDFNRRLFDTIKVDGKSALIGNDETLATYGRDSIHQSVEKVLQDKGIIKHNSKKDIDDVVSDIYELMKNDDDKVDDFCVKHGSVPAGESIFYKIPPLHAKIMKMSNNDLIFAELGIREEQKLVEEQKTQLANEMKQEANRLILEMNNLNPKPADTPAYRDMKEALVNVTRLGTPEFIVQRHFNDNIGGYKFDKSSTINKTTLGKAANNLCKITKEYFKDLMAQEKQGKKYDWTGHKFAQKVEDFAWGKGIKTQSLPIEKNNIDELALLQKAKQVRKIENREITEKNRVNVSEDLFTKEMNNAMKAYNKAYQLHRCSSEYKKVGRELFAFREKYNAMLQIEKDLHDPKKPYEPGLNKKLIKAVKAVKESISKIKKANDEYIVHKKKDKQYGEDAETYSKERIKAVEGINYSVNWLDKVMDRKMDYVVMDATFYGYYDAMRRNIVRKLEKEELPELTKVARIAVDSMDKLCKMPNHYDKTPLTEAELQKYSYDIAAITLADYVNTKPGQKYIEDAKKESGNLRYTEDFFKKLVKQVSESDAFKKALPKDLSKDGITKLITEGQEVHDLRGRFVTYMMREKNAVKEAARNVQNGMNQPAKVGNQPIKNNNKPGGQSGNEEIKKPELKQRPM